MLSFLDSSNFLKLIRHAFTEALKIQRKCFTQLTNKYICFISLQS